MISLQNKIFDNPVPQWYQLEERVGYLFLTMGLLYKLKHFPPHNFIIQSEPFEDVATYRGDIIVGLKFIPADSSSASSSHGILARKLSLRTSFLHSNANNQASQSTKGSLHVMIKEAKHVSPVKANGHVDAFCKR